MNIRTTRLYRVKQNIPMMAQKDDILWLVGSRKSSLGGYIGNFQRTYEHSNNTTYSPNGTPVDNIPMFYVEAID